MTETAGPTPPPELFLSYAREDRDAAQRLAHPLGEEGLTVWWDREIRGGRDFTEEIAANLRAARRMLVLWSETAVASSFVRDESARARDAGKLLPLRIEAADLPLGFGQIQTLDLIDRDGDRQAAEFRAVVNGIRHAFGHKPTPVAGTPGRRLPWRKWAWLGVVAVIAGLGYGALQWRNQARAEQFFQNGVAAQFATQPNLESARNNYLSALDLRPRHARTRYYLAHVYAQLKLLDAARADFEAAVRLNKGALHRRPVAWIQIAHEAQRPLAEQLAQRLREAGYDAPAAENVGDKAPPTRSEIRTQGNSDQGLARWQARVLQKLGLGEVKLTVLRKVAPKVDSYEIWFDRELCAKRIVAGCGPASN